MLKAFLLDIENKKAKAVEFEPSLSKYYELLHCTTIDIVVRKVGDRTFDVICDDEGLSKEPHHISAVSPAMEPMLVGSLLFVHHDAEGNTTSLVGDDAEYLAWHVHHVKTRNDPAGHPCMTRVQY